ncbi:MAG: heme exporter protein CcmD [Hyphomicrobiales bacterium]
MDFSAAHVGFVLWSYSISAVVLVGLIVWIRQWGKATRAKLERLEASGKKRRRAASEISS